MDLRRFALLLVAMTLLASCGSPSGTQAGGAPATLTTLDPETPVSSTPGDDAGGPSGPREVKPHPGQADLHRIRWAKAVVGRNDRTLRVHFTSGVEPCYVLDHVDVKYRRDVLVVTLFEGHDPDDADTACIEIAESKVTNVRLSEPVDGRKVIDGAR